ncbi:MAG: hypothetical protein HY783_01985 [Chloroflexi bacterium]|nr:hypothetical protein [Chloroflexota bacterium]
MSATSCSATSNLSSKIGVFSPNDPRPYIWDKYPAGIGPENFAHTGMDKTSLRSAFGWDSGGALAGSALVENHFGGLYVDLTRNRAFGIDGCRVHDCPVDGKGVYLTIREELDRTRDLTVMIEGVGLRRIHLTAGGTCRVSFEL